MYATWILNFYTQFDFIIPQSHGPKFMRDENRKKLNWIFTEIQSKIFSKIKVFWATFFGSLKFLFKLYFTI
jgi:hypothetical protein